MGSKVQLRRLSRSDFEGLLAAHQKLSETIGLLHQTNWQAASACIVLLGDVDRWICALYNKAEASLKARLGLPIADPPGQPEAAASSAASVDQAPKPEGQD